MSDTPYLKNELSTNVPEVVTMMKRGASYPEKKFVNGKPTDETTGKMTYLYVFRKSNGQEAKHYAKEYEQEVLKLFSPGEELQVVRKERIMEDSKRVNFLEWTPKDGSEARSAATPQLHGNTAETRQERKQDAYAHEQQVKSMQISLQGFMQAHISAGKTNEEALVLAVQAREMLAKEVVRQLSIDATVPEAMPLPPTIPYEPSIKVQDLPF